MRIPFPWFSRIPQQRALGLYLLGYDRHSNAWCELITGIHGRCPQLVELLYLQNKEHFYG